MSFRALTLPALLLTLAACATHPLIDAPPMPVRGTHPIGLPYVPQSNESGLFHLSCTDRYPDGTSVYAIFDAPSEAEVSRAELARRHFVHAAMANNTYRAPVEKPVFSIPGWYRVQSLQSRSGLLVDVYADASSLVESQKMVVAYRGTDAASARDWRNNLALREPPQYREAYGHLKALKAEYPDVKVVATGHSLGGGIALNMSMRFRGVDAVVFNPSPRIHFGSTSSTLDNYRASIYEVGEMLDLVTGPWTRLRLPSNVKYGNYNFLDYRALSISPLPEHGIYELTRGLLLVALTRGDSSAKEMFAANIDRDAALRIDAAHCADWFR